MPKMNGYEVCNEYRKNGLKETPIFIMSGKDIHVEEEGKESGATASIKLPYKNKELLALVKKHLS
jgi:DNA-binding response OmpR family regulator